MTPQRFAKAIASIERKYGLKLDAQEVWLKLDAFKKVKELKGGKCNESKGWYGLKGGCVRGKKGEGESKSKESKLAIAGKIKERKSKTKPLREKQSTQSKVTSVDKTNYEVKRSTPLDIESLSIGETKFSENRVASILKSGVQSELPIVILKPGKGLDLDAETYSAHEEIASYREASKRDANLKGRMDVVIVASKEEALNATKQQKLISKQENRREPIKESRLLDIENFKVSDNNFKKEEIEQLAESISKSGGLYQGPQVRQTGLEEWSTRSKADSYAVLAYRRALEINPELKGRIMAQFV